MDSETARMIVIAIAVLMAIVWLGALQFVSLAGRERRARKEQDAERFGFEDPPPEGTYTGEAELDGSPEELSQKLAASLARGSIGPVSIAGCSPEEVSFTSSGPPNMASAVRSGRFRFTRSGSRTRVAYTLRTSSGRVLLGLAWLFLALGLAVLAAIVWIQFRFVVPNPNPQVRYQVFQTFQAIHLLWPPYLLAFLSRQPARVARAAIETLVNNLPYS